MKPETYKSILEDATKKFDKAMYRTNFYYTPLKMKCSCLEPTKILYEVKHCVRPQSTNAYKNLRRMFDSGLISSYGWERT